MAHHSFCQLSVAALSLRDTCRLSLLGKRLSLLGLCLILLLVALPEAAHAQTTVIYVDGDAPNPVHDGSSWATAYKTVQEALDKTNTNGATDYEIWVAEGVYYPDEGGSHVNNSRDESFGVYVDNVQIYGGFAGGETQRDQRDWVAHPTILSGDIDKNNTLDDGNAYHVVFLDGASNEDITAATVLDGFTITAGNANSDVGLSMFGGGVFCAGKGAGNLCSPLLTNVTISGNNARQWGGGIYNDGWEGGESSPKLTNVIISGNSAGEFGGGMFNQGGNGGESSPLLTNVTISGNYASYGGGMYNAGQDTGLSSPLLTNVTISGNNANVGGGMFNDGNKGVSSPLLTNVLISGNSAVMGGGGMYNNARLSGASSPRLTNVTISGNSAYAGGGMYNYGWEGGVSSPTLTNVTISGNNADWDGGGMYNNGEIGESSPQLRNTIVWGNRAASSEQIYNKDATLAISYSNVQGGGYAGTGNIDRDPLFAAPVAASSAPTITGDYRLLPGSPSIDSGTNGGAPTTDIRGLSRPVNVVTDMGAYEARGFTLAITGGNVQATRVGAAFGKPLGVQISSLGGEPIGPGGAIVFTPPSSGPGLSTNAPFTVSSDAGGLVTVAVTANGEVGSYSVSAAMRGAADAVVFNLTNTPNQCTVVVSASPPAGGSANGGGTYTYGETVTVAATANAGYTFVNWTEGGSGVSTDASYSFTAAGNRTLVANFSQSGPSDSFHLYLPAVNR